MSTRLLNGTRLELVQDDITTQQVDAIVNAANSELAGGGGVDGAIHHAGGPQIMEECRRLGGCPTGEAVFTAGGDLPAQWVIHAVGPIYSPAWASEAAALLADTYRNSLQRAVEIGAQSVAFPSISTGVYDYPVDEAASIALATVHSFLQSETHSLQLVRFVLFNVRTYNAFHQALSQIP